MMCPPNEVYNIFHDAAVTKKRKKLFLDHIKLLELSPRLQEMQGTENMLNTTIKTQSTKPTPWETPQDKRPRFFDR